jgi:hypothetical protein
MNPQGTITKMTQRTQRYWYEDGISDLGMGGLLLLMGVLFAAESLTPAGSPLWAVLGMGLPIVLIGAGVVVGWAIKRAKSRLIFPRTGFVEYERKGLTKTVRLFGMALVAAAIAVGMVLIYRQFMNMTLFWGIAFLGAFAFMGYRVGLGRYLALGLWCLVLGVVISAISLSLEQGSALFSIGAGVGMIMSGIIVYGRYNQNAPMPQETDDGTSH